MSIRCGLAYSNLAEFRAALVAGGRSCFVPYPEEVANGSVLELDISVGEAQLEVRGEVTAADFDEFGNVGLRVTLDEPSWVAVTQLEAALAGGARAPALFSTSRMQIDATKSSPDLSSTPAPGDELPEQQLEPGTLIDGRFRIDSHLATGGMGEVYRAEHVHLKRAVALKLLRRSLLADPESWTRFEREAQLVSRLENAHIVRVFDFGRTEDQQLFLAMEYVDGDTLDVRLAKGPLEPRAAVEILTQVLEGLGEAHALGVVHRDLKPANIILGRRRDGGERAKILDFGIARLSDKATGKAARLTQLGVVVGTPAYLAPEQALADELDHRTDIYALGCVAYELLTGRPPFVAAELRKVVSAHLTANPEPLEKLVPALAKHARLNAAVLKALAKEKERRFQNVTEFKDALLDALARPGAAAVEVLVPSASTPWPPPAQEVSEWQAAPEAAPASTAPSAVVQPADDFFSNMGPSTARPAAAVRQSPPPALAAFLDVVSESTLAKLQQAAPAESARGSVVRFEVMGPQHRTPVEQHCLGRVLEEVVTSGGFVAAVDDEGVTCGFVGEGASAGRAVRAMLGARDVVALEGQRQQAPSAVRAFAAAATFPLSAEAGASLRQKLARARGGNLWLDVPLSVRAARLCTFTETETAGVVACGARKPGGLSIAELLGRRPVVDALERRLASLKQGMGVSLLVTGPVRGGASTMANLLLAGSKKRQFFTARAMPESARPYSSLTSLLCQAVGIAPEERFTRLEKTLEKLFIIEPIREAALAVAGVRSWPTLPTPGQAAHAVRVVLRGAAGELPVVVVFDSLQLVDQQSFETFVAMAARPASRELVVGFTAPSERDALLKELQQVALPQLDAAEVGRAASSALRATAGASLTAWLHEHARGVAGTAIELLAWLDETGSLVDREGIVEIAQAEVAPPEVDVRLARLALLPAADRLLLQAVAALGVRSDITTLRRASPEATPERLASLQVTGWLVTDGGRQVSMRSHSVREALLGTVGADVHARCAAALIEQGKQDATSVDYAALGAHLVSAGDGARAAPLWKHALDLAQARSDARNGSVAWQGIASAMALMPPSDAQARGRVDALARAAAQALVAEDVPRARALLDELAPLAAALPTPSPEAVLVEAKALRLEGRRVKAAELLPKAEAAAQGSPVLALVLTERGEARELEGDLDAAVAALEAARPLAPAAAELARWHGDVSLVARLEARLATIMFARRDVARASELLERSLAAWRHIRWPHAEARVLSTQGTVFAYQQRFDAAAKAYEAAAAAALRCGDLLFQARALLQQAKALRKIQGESAVVRGVAQEVRKLAAVLGWEQGRLDASAMLGG